MVKLQNTFTDWLTDWLTEYVRGVESLLRKQNFSIYLRYFPHFVDAEDLFLCSQEPRHLSLSWARLIQSSLPHLTHLLSVLISTSTLRSSNGSLFFTPMPHLARISLLIRATCLPDGRNRGDSRNVGFLSVLPLTVASGQRTCLRSLFDHRNNICQGLQMMNLPIARL